MQNIKNKTIKKIFISFLIISVSINSYISYKRVSVWNNSLSVWNDAINNSKQVHPLFYYERGLEELKQATQTKNKKSATNLYNLAINDFNNMVEKDGVTYWKAYYKIGLCNLALGKKEIALRNFNKSIEISEVKTITNKNEKKELTDLYLSKENLLKELNQ